MLRENKLSNAHQGDVVFWLVIRQKVAQVKTYPKLSDMHFVYTAPCAS